MNHLHSLAQIYARLRWCCQHQIALCVDYGFSLKECHFTLQMVYGQFRINMSFVDKKKKKNCAQFAIQLDDRIYFARMVDVKGSHFIDSGSLLLIQYYEDLLIKFVQ